MIVGGRGEREGAVVLALMARRMDSLGAVAQLLALHRSPQAHLCFVFGNGNGINYNSLCTSHTY